MAHISYLRGFLVLGKPEYQKAVTLACIYLKMSFIAMFIVL